MSTLENLLPALHHVIRDVADVPLDALKMMPTSGLAHDHVTIDGTDWLLRVPRQSQMQFDAAHNLIYQQTCFERMSVSGHTPNCHLAINPNETLPMGALLVDRIYGKTLQAPEQLATAAQALAAIHQLPLPEITERAPLINQQNPMRETLKEVLSQAAYLHKAELTAASLDQIEMEINAAERDVSTLPKSPVALISFDAHPGNFIVDDNNHAWLVDLEKGRYGGAGFDLAHASLYTSTTWDVATYAELTAAEIKAFYQTWLDAMPTDLANQWQPFLLPMRRLMWLWSITWCAKWRVESAADLKTNKHSSGNTEDWSADNTNAALIEHVRNRVDHYLLSETIERVRGDWTDNWLLQ